MIVCEQTMLTIRSEQFADAAAIFDVHCAAFPTDAEARLVDRLRENGNARMSLVAVVDDLVVGHIVFSPVSLIAAAAVHAGLGLAPLAVLPSYQGRGVGSALVREGLAACRRQMCPFVVVLGHPAYYPQFGFRRASALGIANEYNLDEQFMVLELQPGSLPYGGGLMKYGPAFAEFAR